MKHLRLVHLKDLSFRILCGIDNCSEVYRCFASFNTHLYRNHRVALGLQRQWAIADDLDVPGSPTLSDINETPALDVSDTPGLPTVSDDISATPVPVFGDSAMPGLLTLSDDMNAAPAPGLDAFRLPTQSDETLAESLDDAGVTGSPILSDETTSDTDVEVGDMTVVSFAHQPELFSSRQYVHDACLHRKRENAKFLLMLSEGKQVSQVALDEIVQGCREICKQTVSQTKERVLCVLNQAGVNVTDIPGLEESLCCSEDPFESIDTAYLRKKFYKKHFNYMVSTKCIMMYTCMYIIL